MWDELGRVVSMRRTKELRKKLLGVAGMVMMMCFMFVHCSIISEAAEGKVTASSAKIRKEASTTSEVVGGALQNDTYTITAETTGADGRIWYQITFDGNKTGYIRSDLMQKTGDVPSTGTNTGATINPTVSVTDVQPVSATITGNSVRVRSDASTNGAIITNVVRDVVVTITGQATDSQNKTWYRVSFSNESGEVQGFIREDFLTVSGTIAPVVDTPVVDTPVVDNPSVDTPVIDTPTTSLNDYEVINEDGVWYLVDNTAGFKYSAKDLIAATKSNEVAINNYKEQVASQKKIVVVLVILVIALGVAATLLFLKMKDVMDEAYFAAVEKETIRQRQGQKANNSANANTNKSKSVMHTVGANGNTANKQAQKTTSVPKPATTAGKPQQSKPVGAQPQTVKVSNPADTRPKPAPQQQRPVEQAKPVQKPVQKPVEAAPVQKTAPAPKPVSQQPKPEQIKSVDNTSKQSWQSKNFMADDDDEFEFEFLNWDGSEEN